MVDAEFQQEGEGLEMRKVKERMSLEESLQDFLRIERFERHLYEKRCRSRLHSTF